MLCFGVTQAVSGAQTNSLPYDRFTTHRLDCVKLRLARKSAQWNGLLERYEIRMGDFRDDGVLRPDERFDLVLGSPPYFPPGSGVEGDHPQKVACRFEMRGDIADYCVGAARHLETGPGHKCKGGYPPSANQILLKVATIERQGS